MKGRREGRELEKENEEERREGIGENMEKGRGKIRDTGGWGT